jgi:hypothetical protein
MDTHEKLVDAVSEADAAFVFGHCERLGEDGARKAVASNYFSLEHRPMASLWLHNLDLKRQKEAALEVDASPNAPNSQLGWPLCLRSLQFFQRQPLGFKQDKAKPPEAFSVLRKTYKNQRTRRIISLFSARCAETKLDFLRIFPHNIRKGCG